MRAAWASFVEVGALVLFAILFGVAGTTLFGRSIAVVAPLPAAASPVIPPGREPQVMELLRALGPTFAGHALGDTSIEKDEIRVRLVGADEAGSGASTGGRCAGPDWVQAPGGLRLRYGGARRDGDEARSGEATSGDLTMTWFLCGAEAETRDVEQAPRALDRARASVDPTRIWMTVASPATATRTASTPPGAGLLTPVVAAIGIAPQWIAILTWTTGFALAIALSRAIAHEAAGSLGARGEAARRRARARRTRSIVAAALVVGGIALRVRLASSRALDGDEPWAFPTTHPVFSNDHDAWVHPPIFRALQGFIGAAAGWHPGDALLVLRAPSVVASCVALVLVAVAAHRAGAIVALLPLAVVALSPVVAGDGVLARPYGLAACFVATVAVALFTPSPSRRDGLRLSLAVVAFGAAAWTDLLAGLVAALVLAVALYQRRFRWRVTAAVALTAAVWAVPLLFGALSALGHQVTPPPLQAGAPAPDLGPIHGLGHGQPLHVFDTLASFTVVGAPIDSILAGFGALVCLLALLAIGRRARLVGPAAAPLVAIGLLAVIGTQVALRPRNILFLPHLVAIVAALVIGVAARRPRTKA